MDNRAFIGILLIALGIGFLFDQLGFTSVFGFGFGELIGMFWPLILVFIGVSFLSKRSTVAGLVFVGLGIAFLFSEVLQVDVWGLIWPLFIVGIGFKMLTKPSEAEKNSGSGTKTADLISESIFFWGLEQVYTTDDFKGGKISCVFGGAELDLTQIQIKDEEVTIDISCIFAGIEIKVPRNIHVEVDTVQTLAGWENSFQQTADESAPTLRFTGSVTFGGVEITN